MLKDTIGLKFNKLKILDEKREDKTTHCLCLCDCGNKKWLPKADVKRGHVKSCGCLRLKMFHTPQYKVWATMKQRCNNKNDKGYKNYGGRGITYDKKWETFAGFWEDMEKGYNPELFIDRIDNNDNYYKENCRWVTRFVNNTNKRNTKRYKYNGRKLTIPEWAVVKNINKRTLYSRIYQLKWTIEKTLNT